MTMMKIEWPPWGKWAGDCHSTAVLLGACYLEMVKPAFGLSTLCLDCLSYFQLPDFTRLLHSPTCALSEVNVCLKHLSSSRKYNSGFPTWGDPPWTPMPTKELELPASKKQTLHPQTHGAHWDKSFRGRNSKRGFSAQGCCLKESESCWWLAKALRS